MLFGEVLGAVVGTVDRSTLIKLIQGQFDRHTSES